MGNADFMDVEEWTPEGELARILRIRDYPLVLSAAVLRAERDALLEGRSSSSRFHEVAERTPPSGNRPAYDDIIVDPSGALWLRQYRGRTERAGPRRWLVLAADGTWLGAVDMPDRFRVVDIELDAVLGVWRDELNVQHPQILGLDRG